MRIRTAKHVLTWSWYINIYTHNVHWIIKFQPPPGIRWLHCQQCDMRDVKSVCTWGDRLTQIFTPFFVFFSFFLETIKSGKSHEINGTIEYYDYILLFWFLHVCGMPSTWHGVNRLRLKRRWWSETFSNARTELSGYELRVRCTSILMSKSSAYIVSADAIDPYLGTFSSKLHVLKI